MSKWNEVRLGELIDINPETLSVSKYNGKIQYIDIASVNRGQLDGYTEYDIVDAPSRARRIIRNNDIIYSTVRPNLRAYYYVKDCPDNAICSTGFAVLRAKENVDSRFIYSLVTENSFVDYLSLVAKGSAYPAADTTDFKKAKVTVPDLPTQKRIADILSAYDHLIENNNRRIVLLEKAAQELYKEWFVRFRFPNHENTEFENGIPVGWERTTFEKIASFQNGYAFKSEELLGSSEDDTYEVFKQGHIMRGGGFKAEGTKSWYPKSKCADLNKFVLHKNDILMAMTDMKDNVAILGNTALLPHDNRYILNQRVGLLRPTNYRKVGFAYIYLLTNSYDFVNDLRSRANRGVQVNLSAAQIRSSATVVPSEEINEKFEQIINPIFEEVFNILNQNENLIKQRDLLLPRLMSGKLEV